MTALTLNQPVLLSPKQGVLSCLWERGVALLGAGYAVRHLFKG